MSDKDFSTIGDPIVIVSHPRSGTHLTIDLLRKQFKNCASYKFPLEPQHYLYLSIEGFLDRRKESGSHEKEGLKIASRAKRPIIKFHTYSYEALHKDFPHWMKWIDERGKFIYVMRDVLDVLSSFYIYARSFKEEANVPFGEFIKQPYCGRANRVVYWKEMVEFWLAKPNTLVLGYNRIIKDTRNVLKQVGDFINEEPLYKEPLLPEKLNSIWQFRRDRIFSIRPESSIILGDRLGRKLDWRKELSKEDLEFVYEQAGDTLARF